MIVRFSEQIAATGGLVAEGALKQLGRPDIEPLEILIREAVQNCWDARRETSSTVRVDIGRRRLDEQVTQTLSRTLLPDPPPKIPLGRELRANPRLLYFADYGTSGLGGPTRADRVGDRETRDFVDFVRNVGQPRDKTLGGGSYGYGKAVFFTASRARTIIVDTLCETHAGPERRLIGMAIGSNYVEEGKHHTGRHWWGRLVDGVPEPLLGDEAAMAASLLRLPERRNRDDLGTTIAIIAPGLEPDDDVDRVMPFIAEALLWNFWPKMTHTPDQPRAAMEFRLFDEDERLPVPDPRMVDRLRPFVEAMDRLRSIPDADDDPTVIETPVRCKRPSEDLGHLVIQRAPVQPTDELSEGAMPAGMAETSKGLHHVALMRNAELVVKYFRGAEPVTRRHGYAGVFRCSPQTDDAFKNAEPPTHDDWVPRSVADGRDRTLVRTALRRIKETCREAAGVTAPVKVGQDGSRIPLGEFADGLARLLPGFAGPGARRIPVDSARDGRGKDGRAVRDEGRSPTEASATDRWPLDGSSTAGGSEDESGGSTRPPTVREVGSLAPSLAEDGTPVLRYPFELHTRGNRVRLRAVLRVMTNDGTSVEKDPPRNWVPPQVQAWIDPAGHRHRGTTMLCEPGSDGGRWLVEIPIVEEALVSVEVRPEVAP